MKSINFISTRNFSTEIKNLNLNGVSFRNTITEEGLDVLIEKEPIWPYLGEIYKENLFSSPFFYAKNIEAENEEFNKLLYQYTATINQFFDFLWFVKDCSCYTDLSAAVIVYNGYTALGGNFTRYYKANCEQENAHFSQIEIDEAISMIYKWIEIKQKHSRLEIKQKINTTEGYVVVKDEYSYIDLNRIQRAYNFLTEARSSYILPAKIANYVVILECLFSANAKEEISHKVAERIAYYLYDTLAERSEVFSFIKKCYDVRSKYIHGQALDKKDHTTEKLREISVKLDILVRSIFKRVIEIDSDIFLQDQNQLENWFKELLFKPLFAEENSIDLDQAQDEITS